MRRRVTGYRGSRRFATLLAAVFAAVPGTGYAQAAEEQRISGDRRFGAAVVSAYVGLGLGHDIVGYGDVAVRFRTAQAAGFMMGAAGIFLGFQGCGDPGPCAVSTVGQSLFWGGAAVYVGARLWELLDVIVRPAAHNARVDRDKNQSEATRKSQLALVAVLQPERRGLGLRISF